MGKISSIDTLSMPQIPDSLLTDDAEAPTTPTGEDDVNKD